MREGTLPEWLRSGISERLALSVLVKMLPVREASRTHSNETHNAAAVFLDLKMRAVWRVLLVKKMPAKMLSVKEHRSSRFPGFDDVFCPKCTSPHAFSRA
jgi:hypothetical protein